MRNGNSTKSHNSHRQLLCLRFSSLFFHVSIFGFASAPFKSETILKLFQYVECRYKLRTNY